MKEFIRQLVSLLYPPRCPFCRAIYPDGICPSCEKELSLLKNLRRYQTEFCTEYYAPYLYRGLVRTGLIQLKFRGKSGQEEWFAKQMIEALPIRNFDGVISVPPHRKGRKDERDISALLSRETAKALEIPYWRNVALKIKDTLPQHEVSREKRYVNLQNAFVVKDEVVMGKRILLCDDIITTGSTVNELAKACKKAGANEVYAAAFAISLIRENQKRG